MTKEELQRIRIEAPDESYGRRCKENWDRIAKPLDSMGEFEKLGTRIASIRRDCSLDISHRAVFVLCGDNGVVEEGISQSGQEVTLSVMRLLGEGKSSVCQLAGPARVDVIPVDIGVNTVEKVPGVKDRKISAGTKNFRREPAMTEQEVLAAIECGIELVRESQQESYQILALGEMGIGNTTTSTAAAAALLNLNVREICGRGAGLSDAGLLRKIQIIEEALEKYGLYGKSAFEILQTVGGLDIAGLTGICIGGALYHVPIVLDGVISAVAALAAERICPGIKDYLIASHLGKEPAMEKLLRELQLRPLIHGNLAFGEGTGAVLLFPLLDTAFSLYKNALSFQDAKIGAYQRFGHAEAENKL